MEVKMHVTRASSCSPEAAPLNGRCAHRRAHAVARSFALCALAFLCALLLARCDAQATGALHTEVAGLEGLRLSVANGTRHITITAKIYADEFADSGTAVVLPVSKSTRSIRGRCGREASTPGVCTLRAPPGYTLLSLHDPDTQLWLAMLRIVAPVAPPAGSAVGSSGDAAAGASLLLSVQGPRTRVWMTNVDFYGTDASIIEACAAPARALAVAGGAQVLCTGCSFSLLHAPQGSIASITSGATVTFLNSLFYGCQATDAGLFLLDAPPADSLRFLNAKFTCNAAPPSCVMSAALPAGMRTCGDVPASRRGELHIFSEADLETSAAGRRWCGTPSPAFIDTTDPDFELIMQEAGNVSAPLALDPSESGCAVVKRCPKQATLLSAACTASSEAAAGRSFPPVGPDSRRSHFRLIGVVAAAVGVALLLVALCAGIAHFHHRKAQSGADAALPLPALLRRRPTEDGLIAAIDYQDDIGDGEVSVLTMEEALDPRMFLDAAVGCACIPHEPGDDAVLLCPKCCNTLSGEVGEYGADRRPKLLPCGHSICADCVLRLHLDVDFKECDWVATASETLPLNFTAIAMLPVASRAGVPCPSVFASTPRTLLQARPTLEAKILSSAVEGAGGAASDADSSTTPAPGALDLPTPFTSQPKNVPPMLRPRGLSWQPDEEALFCELCCELIAAEAPAPDAPDHRPVVFACGHSACSTCARKVLSTGQCHKRCSWTLEQRQRPVQLNHLVIGLLQLTAERGESLVLQLSQRMGHVRRTQLAEDLAVTHAALKAKATATPVTDQAGAPEAGSLGQQPPRQADS